MASSKWSDTLLTLGEEKITQLVNQILSKSHSGCEKKQVWIEEYIQDLDLASRKEMEDLKEKVESLNAKIAGLTVRLEELQKGVGKAAPKKKKAAKKE